MAKLRHGVASYYVYDGNVGNDLCGVPVMTQDDTKARVVIMTDQQARYWLDQGVIGSKPLADRSEASRGVLSQMTKNAVPPPAATSQKKADVEEPQQERARPTGRR